MTEVMLKLGIHLAQFGQTLYGTTFLFLKLVPLCLANLTQFTVLLFILLPTELRDVTTGATGATAVVPKFSDTLTLSQPRGEDSVHHQRGRS